MSNVVEVKVPAGKSTVRISTYVSAAWQQRVTIKPDGPLLYLYQWAGCGENGTQIGATEENRNRDRTFTITAEHSEDGGKSWKPNSIKVVEVATDSHPSKHIISVTTEDGSDKDYDDSVTHFEF